MSEGRVEQIGDARGDLPRARVGRSSPASSASPTCCRRRSRRRTADSADGRRSPVTRVRRRAGRSTVPEARGRGDADDPARADATCGSTSRARRAAVPCTTVTDLVFQGPVVRARAADAPTAREVVAHVGPRTTSRCCGRATRSGSRGSRRPARAACRVLDRTRSVEKSELDERRSRSDERTVTTDPSQQARSRRVACARQFLAGGGRGDGRRRRSGAARSLRVRRATLASLGGQRRRRRRQARRVLELAAATSTTKSKKDFAGADRHRAQLLRRASTTTTSSSRSSSPSLQQGEYPGFDIVVPPTGWPQRLIDLGYVQELPLDDIPNAANLVPQLAEPAFDPTGEYTLPWQTGMSGIAYNIEITGRELTSVDDLFDGVQEQDRDPERDARHHGPVAALGRRRSRHRDLRGGRAGLPQAGRRQSTRVRSARFTTNDYEDDLVAGTSPPASAGRVTSPRSRSTTRICAS